MNTPDITATFRATFDGVEYDVTYDGDFDDDYPTGGNYVNGVNITRMVATRTGKAFNVNAGRKHSRIWHLATDSAVLDMANRVLQPVPKALTPINLAPLGKRPAKRQRAK